MELGKVPPHDLEAEQAILGSMLTDKDAVISSIERLKENDFYRDDNRAIYTAILNLYNRAEPIDIITVKAELESMGKFEQVGGLEYLAELPEKVPTTANALKYIKIVEEKAILRRLIEEATCIVSTGYDTTNTIEDVLENAEKKILNVVKTRKGTEFKTIQEVLLKAQSDMEKLSQTTGEITGIATGFYDLDKITTGLHENELIIVAARPGLGKTAFALNLATNMALNSHKTVALFNMEMSSEQLILRMISSVGQIDGYRLENGKLENNDWKKFNEAVSRLSKTKIFLDDTSGMTIGEIRAKCRRLSSSSEGLGVIIIDYLQLISGSSKYAGQRQQEVSEISRSLKTMAMELGVPVIALAQLSRSVEGREDKRPLLSDLRESGSIEQDADIVAFLFREDYYTKEISIDENTSKTELIIAKHRNGPTSTIDLIFKRNTSTFVNAEKVKSDME